MFQVSGALRGRAVSVRWLDPPGDPPGARLEGDDELRLAVEGAVAGEVWIAPTPTGPAVQAALDPPEVALATILALLDRDVETFATGDVPELATAVPPDAIA